MCLLMMQWLHNKVVLDTTSVAAVLTSSNYFHQLCKSPVCGSLFERDFIEFLYSRSDQKKKDNPQNVLFKQKARDKRVGFF